MNSEGDGEVSGEEAPAEPDWKRRRRLAEIFGDVLPSVTSDERDDDDGRRTGDSAAEEWLKRQVPPHHG